MNNSATTRRISKIAVEYNGNDKGTAEMVYYNNLMSENAEHQFLEMKTVAERNAKITNWAMTGYISPENGIHGNLSNEQLVNLTLKALQKVGVTDDNQIRLDIHNSTKHRHIHFIVNRVNTHGKNTIEAHRLGERFGKAVREICKEMNLKTDVEIGIEKKAQMLNDLRQVLKTAKSFSELTDKMKDWGYRVTLSENKKDGVSGMRIVRLQDINGQTQRQYNPGHKLSEITSKLKIKDIKEILNRNSENGQSINFSPSVPQGNEIKHPEKSTLKEIENAVKEMLKPTYAPADDELLNKKRRKR
jgi:hypothetical protein